MEQYTTSRFVIIVTGDRHATAPEWDRRIRNTLRTLPDDTILIHGAARGIDSIAAAIGRSYGFTCIAMPANWDTHGRAAGPIRNQHMVDLGLILRAYGYHVVVHAFHDSLSTSRGTKHMVRISETADLPVHIHTGEATL